MNAASLARSARGVFNHVRYTARAAVRVKGGYKVGYQLEDEAWNWSEAKYADLEKALEAAVEQAHEAISMGESRPKSDPPS